MRILLTGIRGQVGWELQRTLAPLGRVYGFDRNGMDLADPDAIRRVVREVKPALVVNAAAYTAVDKAESEPDLAMAINATAPAVLSEEAHRIGAALMHYSTDYVFDGRKEGAYVEDDALGPLGAYGRSKLAGEEAIRAIGIPHLILRTSWVYSTRGKNFLRTILKLAAERDELRVVDDQRGAPTWCRSIAEATTVIIATVLARDGDLASGFTRTGGVYHLSAADHTTWRGFAQAILDERAKLSVDHLRTRTVTPIPSSAYPTPAERPRYSILSNARLRRDFGVKLPHWKDSLRLCLDSECGANTSAGDSARSAT